MTRVFLMTWLCITLAMNPAFAAEKQPADIKTFTQSMQRQSGFFDFYYQPDTGKVFLKVAQTDVPFLFQSSLPQGIGSNDIGLDRGQLGDTRLVQFERFGDKILLKQLNTQYRASSPNAAERKSIDEAFADSVIAGLPIVASDKSSVLVDYTDFLLSDIHQISERLSDTEQGSYRLDKQRSGVYLPRSKSFVDNTELEALVTFAGSKPGEYVRQVTPSPESITVHLHHSLIRLPDDGYQTRPFHPYSGFWQISYQDYSSPIDSSMTVRLIPRHRLQKKDPSAAVSEAVEPIVYYLDPGIPEPVMSALKDGAMWWNQAFEKIGYKDAFQVKVLPEDADPMDVRYNVIQWVHRATRGWSYGSSVIDPRTGEIIKGHVTLGSLRVRQDYLIALGLTSPFKDDNANTESQKNMALARIRQLSAHEVGHTLGIAHNFAASADGRESVMDYPHPKITVQGSTLSLEDAYDVGMGQWDNYVIAYGYQDLREGQNEIAFLTEQVQRAREQGLSYLSDPDARPASGASASGHLWDNGATPLVGLKDIFAARDIALQNFGLDTLKKGQPLSSLEETLVPIYYLHRYQAESVAKLIAGVHYEYESKGDYTPVKGLRKVDAQQQNEAIDALITTLSEEFLTLPTRIETLILPKAYGDSRNRESFKGRTGLTFDSVSAAEAAAGYSAGLLLQPHRLNRLAQQDMPDVSVATLLDRIFAATFKSRGKASATPIAQRVDYVLVQQVMNAIENPELAPEVRGQLQQHLQQWRKWMESKSRQAHHKALAEQLSLYEQTGQWQGQFTIKALPPGSPI